MNVQNWNNEIIELLMVATRITIITWQSKLMDRGKQRVYDAAGRRMPPVIDA